MSNDIGLTDELIKTLIDPESSSGWREGEFGANPRQSLMPKFKERTRLKPSSFLFINNLHK